MKSPHEHLLIIRFSAMGDVAMMVPVVYSLAQQYPNLRITVLSRPFARFFFANLAPNVSFMEADIKGEYKGLRGLNALYRRLTAKHFTAIADFHSIMRSNYLRFRFNLGRFKVAHIDKHRQMRRRLTSQKNKMMKQLPTSFENYAEVLAKLGYPVEINFKSIYGEGKGDFSTINDRIAEKNISEKWIGVAPFAAHQGKIYPVEKTQEVIAEIIKENNGNKVFLFGAGTEEHSIINKIINNVKAETDADDSRIINASERLNGLGEELILMSHLDVMLSMDSANMHLASLVGTRVVSVWGATHPYAGFLGWNQKEEDAIGMDLACRPCSIYGNKKCIFENYKCMEISPTIIANCCTK